MSRYFLVIDLVSDVGDLFLVYVVIFVFEYGEGCRGGEEVGFENCVSN